MASAAAPLIVRRGRVDSTQAIVFALAAEGAADRTVVVADSQAAGRGRRGRVWHDEPGESLLCSILLRPRLTPAQLPTLSLTAGVAVAEALARAAGLAPRLKWPNDVLVDDRKIAGILLESRPAPASPAATAASAPIIALGIGINIAQRSFPPELAMRATSVRLAGGDVDRDTLLTALLDALDVWRARLEREGFAPVRERWRALADTLGRRVSVDGVTGTAVDVDGDGALLIDDGVAWRRVLGGVVSEVD
ncbi:MAG TPA: biotin--[acetyl-CoA-carboxylase] ligase [Methylomirabilota bacterium]|jgi:BirA family biotin operon repressor/biotin-[acetyl-CoA-carboxylase] ligase